LVIFREMSGPSSVVVAMSFLLFSITASIDNNSQVTLLCRASD
jgi:hypothetical protein